jgi:uncharacterized membrane protein (DUF2068 family)
VTGRFWPSGGRARRPGRRRPGLGSESYGRPRTGARGGPAPTSSGVNPLGVRLIIVYKLVKACLQAVAAVALSLAVRAGFAHRVAHFAIALGDHSVHPLAIRLAHWLSAVATPTHLQVLALILGGDAVVSAVEGWVLRRGARWGRWLIVVTTGALIPLEIYELLRRPRVGRLVILMINVAIVAYLIARLRREGVTSSPRSAPRPLPASPSP